jgi:hypothetical protein
MAGDRHREAEASSKGQEPFRAAFCANNLTNDLVDDVFGMEPDIKPPSSSEERRKVLNLEHNAEVYDNVCLSPEEKVIEVARPHCPISDEEIG